MVSNWAREILLPTNPDLAAILGDTDLYFLLEDVHVLKSLGSQISRIAGSWISRFLDLQISRFLDLGTNFLAMAGCGSWRGGALAGMVHVSVHAA